MTEYDYFETTADIGIEVVSNSIEDAFINSALATMNLVTDVEKMDTTINKEVQITSEDLYALLYDWITEVIMLMNCDFFIASKYDLKITKNDDKYILKATLYGDIYDTDKYNYKTEVKAITYHLMQIDNLDDKYHVKFIVDI